nr:MAG TPA: B-ZIP transcription factor [Caudoviricetes sp.]
MKDREEYISILEQDNAELKKQVEDLFSENRNLRKKLENCMTFEDYKYTLNKKIKLETQQQEFIKYLEDKIYSIEPKGTGINYNCEYDSEEDYVMAMQEQSRLNTLKEILQKYKEIIGGKDEK